jgi:hypothetical protein
MRSLHDLAKIHATFDDPNPVSRAGRVPVMALACRAAGAFFSVTVPMNPHVAAVIQAISDDAWQPIPAAAVSTVTLRRFRS